MKLVIPPECQIGGHTFKIVWSPKILDLQDAKGGSEDREEQIIRLMPNRPAIRIFQTLIHEIIHIIGFIYLSERNEISEEKVALISAGLCQFLISIGIEPDFSQIPEE